MLKLLLRLAACCMILTGITLFLHIKMLGSMQTSADRVYDLKDGQDYLFVGGSEIGCSIEEGTNWHNRVSWVSDAVTETFLMRLREFERRGQLEHVKTVVVPFHFVNLTKQKSEKIMWSFYKELPVAFRHLDILPCSKLKFMSYIACNLRWPLPFLLQSGFPKGRVGITRQPPRKRTKMQQMFADQGRAIALGKDSFPDWEERIFTAYREMAALCQKHGVNFVILNVPVLPTYRAAISHEVADKEAEFFRCFTDAGLDVLNIQDVFPDDLFFDDVHMIEPGRAKFTALVMKRLESGVGK